MNEVVISNEALLPDELCMAEITMPFDVWMSVLMDFFGGECSHTVKRVPQLSAIAAALNAPCPECKYRVEDRPHCPACGGSGKPGVPGASLRPSAESVVIA